MTLSRDEFQAFNSLDLEGCAILKEELNNNLRDFYRRVQASPDKYPIEKQKEYVRQLLDAYCQEGTDYSASIAADYYDAMRAEAGLTDPYSAEMINMRDPEATEGFLDAEFNKFSENLNIESLITQLLSRYDYECRRSSGECVYQNGYRDPNRVLYARVTDGTDCKFCLMLASRGYVYSSKRSAGEGGHYHANCRCRITPGWADKDGHVNAGVKGYDPMALYREWKDIEAEEQARRDERAARKKALEAEKAAN